MPQPLATIKVQKLIADISNLYLKTRRLYVEFARETGRMIVEVEQDGAVRAAYREGVIPKVSKDLTEKYGSGFSESTLEKMRRFYLQRPISSVTTKLDWTDYAELLPIKDERMLKRLETRIIKEDLDSSQIRQLVKKIRHAPEKKSSSLLPPLKRPTDLKLTTFAKSKLTVKIEPGLVLLDCGFFISWPIKKENLVGLNVTDAPSYTYAATIDRVIDGDTLVVLVEVGFGIIMHDKLRLRGIDCPELGTPEGERAKRFVASLLPVGSAIVLKSHKTRVDSFGRFVADVFYKTGTDQPLDIIEGGVYLNQLLLDEGYAVRIKE